MGPAILRADALFDGKAGQQTLALTAKVDTNASADLIAAVAGKRIVVVSGYLFVAGTVTVKFQSGGATDLTGAMTLATTESWQPGFCPVGLLVCNLGEKLNVVLGSGVQISGSLTYVLLGE